LFFKLEDMHKWLLVKCECSQQGQFFRDQGDECGNMSMACRLKRTRQSLAILQVETNLVVRPM
jgi:hypothetical protein